MCDFIPSNPPFPISIPISHLHSHFPFSPFTSLSSLASINRSFDRLLILPLVTHRSKPSVGEKVDDNVPSFEVGWNGRVGNWLVVNEG